MLDKSLNPEIGMGRSGYALPAYLLLLLVSCAVSVELCFHFPGNQIGFGVFALVVSYLYPLWRRWLRPKPAFLAGLISICSLLTVAEALGLAVYELETTGFRSEGGNLTGQLDLVTLAMIVVPFAGVLLSAYTGYLLGWTTLRLWLKIFEKFPRSSPVAAKPGIQAQAALKAETEPPALGPAASEEQKAGSGQLPPVNAPKVLPQAGSAPRQ